MTSSARASTVVDTVNPDTLTPIHFRAAGFGRLQRVQLRLNIFPSSLPLHKTHSGQKLSPLSLAGASVWAANN